MRSTEEDASGPWLYTDKPLEDKVYVHAFRVMYFNSPQHSRMVTNTPKMLLSVRVRVRVVYLGPWSPKQTQTHPEC